MSKERPTRFLSKYNLCFTLILRNQKHIHFEVYFDPRSVKVFYIPFYYVFDNMMHDPPTFNKLKNTKEGDFLKF
jgi:hypothetical protein